MKYIGVSVVLQPYSSQNAEILTAWLSEAGFDSFVENETGLEAFIPAHLYQPEAIEAIKKQNPAIGFDFTAQEIPDQNWNELWEKNYFQPIIIGKECVVRSPFHKTFPDIRYQIVIEPKMSFGTGHHETTSMVMEHILETEMTGKKVLDMGCGTGILGILASMRGATKVTGIDIDSWCTQNSLENCTLNNIHNFEILQGDAQLLVHSEPFDVILANINRNILLEDLPAYCRVLKPGGTIILSGFYHNDLEAIGKKAQEENLIIKNTKENNHWVAVSYESSMNK